MDRTQADAIAQAILAPDLDRQEETRQKRAIEAAYLSRKRKVAWFALVGSAIGAAAADLSGTSLSVGVIWGGLASSALGWLLAHRAAARQFIQADAASRRGLSPELAQKHDVEAILDGIDAKRRALSEAVDPVLKAFEPKVSAAAGRVPVWSSHWLYSGDENSHVYFVVPRDSDASLLREGADWPTICTELRLALGEAGIKVDSGDLWLRIYTQEDCDRYANGNWYYYFK